MNEKHGLKSLLTSLPPLKKAKIDKAAIAIQSDNSMSEEDTLEYGNKGYVQGPIDPFFGQRSAFPINIDVENVQLGKIPENVNEYLAQVKLEAYEISGHDNYESSDDDYCYYKAPEREEIDNFIAPMEVLESYVVEYEAERKIYSEYRMKLEELDAIDLPQTAKDWKKFIWEVSCEKDYIAQIIEEEEHVKLLVYFTKWMSLKVDENFKEWVFGILAAIEDVLPSSEMSVLRQLGKKVLRQYLQSLKLNQPENHPVYLKILSIVGLYYKQRDLIEDNTTI